MRINNYISIFCLAILTSFGLQAQDFFTEDFDGTIPADWTSVEVAGDGTASAVWVWSDAGPQGGIPINPLASTTAANGWVLFDSDLNCSQTTQDAWLISPAINTMDKSSVWLTFETYYASFNDRPQIRVGTDLNDLASWTSYEVFPGIGANDFGGGSNAVNPQSIIMNISDSALGETAVYFAFQFLSDATTANGGNLTACGYAWEVDDVVLTETDPRDPNDMRVNTFYAIAPNYTTPTSQVEAFGFIADIENFGSEDQSNVSLNMSISNTAFSADLAYGDIVVDSLAENTFFNDEFTPDMVEGTYTATYTLSYDNVADDATPDALSQSFTFEVNDTLFSKTPDFNIQLSPAGDDTYTYGNVYKVNSATDVGGDQLYSRYITFGVNNAAELAGTSVAIYLYEWTEESTHEGDFINLDDQEATLIGFNSYTFTGSEGQDLISVLTSTDDAITLNENTFYIAAIQYIAEGDFSCNLLGSDQYDYAAMNFYTDSLNKERYVTALDVGNEGEFDLRGFGYDVVPLIDWSIGSNPLDDVATDEPQLPANAVSLFPNPAKDMTTLDLNFEELTSGNIEVYSVQGQLLLNRSFDSVMNGKIQLDTQELPNGSYMVHVNTALGVRTVKMMVQR